MELTASIYHSRLGLSLTSGTPGKQKHILSASRTVLSPMNWIHPVLMEEPCSIGQCRNSRNLVPKVVTNSLRDYSLFLGKYRQNYSSTFSVKASTSAVNTLCTIQEPENFRFLLSDSFQGAALLRDLTVKGFKLSITTKIVRNHVTNFLVFCKTKLKAIWGLPAEHALIA